MAQRDAISSFKVVTSVDAEALSADKNGSGADGRGFDTVLHVVNIGTGGITFSATNKIELRLQDSDDDSTYADVTAANDVNINTNSSGGVVTAPGSTGIFAAITAATHDNLSYAIGYRGSKRYSRVMVDFSGTHGTATPIAAVAILGLPAQAKV